MGSNKKYTGYKSYQYLEPGVDYKAFKVCKELGRVKSTVITLSKFEEERLQKLLEDNVIVNLHDHPDVYPQKISENIDYFRNGRMVFGYEGMAKSCVDAFFDVYGFNMRYGPDAWSWNNILYQVGLRLSDIAHQDFIIIGKRVDDIFLAHKEGKIALIAHLEGPPTGVGSDLDRIEILYGIGVRCMGITYAQGNELGSSLSDEVDKGLTVIGNKAVGFMNKLGMAIDLAHVGDKTSLDAIEASKDPVFITHAGARALWLSPRMKPDEVIQSMAEKGGVIGIEASPHTTLTQKHRKHTIESVMEHFEYVADLVGIDYVAFGPDTLFGNHVALHKSLGAQLGRHKMRQKKTETGKEKWVFPEVEYVDGLENPSEFPNIARWLVKHGYSDKEIIKVLGDNIIRVLKRVWR